MTAMISTRRKNILTGAVAILLVTAAATIGIKFAFGAFDDEYRLTGSFDAAGQGLISGSDVKIRGVNIGEVAGVELVDGRAQVTMRIADDERIPVDAEAVIRPKTLFGEKFVDIAPGRDEDTGPYLSDGDEIAHTLGGFELERVLADTYPILQAIDPAELSTVLGELAEGGKGLGEAINRTIVNSEELSSLSVENDAQVRQLLGDLAGLSETLADSADSFVAGAEDLNAALPVLTEQRDELTALLEQTSRLSNDLADLMHSNRGFIDASFVDGSRTLDVIDAHTEQVIPLVIGLRHYLELISSSLRYEAGDGTLMGAVKGIVAGDVCGPFPCPGLAPDGDQPAAAPAPVVPGVPMLPRLPPLPDVPLELPLEARSGGISGMVEIFGGLLG